MREFGDKPRLLLDAGEDLEATNDSGRTPLVLQDMQRRFRTCSGV